MGIIKNRRDFLKCGALGMASICAGVPEFNSKVLAEDNKSGSKNEKPFCLWATSDCHVGTDIEPFKKVSIFKKIPRESLAEAIRQSEGTNNDGAPSFEWDIALHLGDFSGNQGFPKDVTLFQNYPNPFNPSTVIKYNLQKSCNVILKIYNIFGQEIETLANNFQTTGTFEVIWQPKNLPNGIYLSRLQAGDSFETMKIILQK